MREKNYEYPEQANLWKRISENEFSELENTCLKNFTENTGFIWALLEFLSLFLDDLMIYLYVTQSTIFMKQYLDNYEDIGNPNPEQKVSVTNEDIWIFLGAIIYMGIVSFPNPIHWRQDSLFGSSILSKFMSKKKF